MDSRSPAGTARFAAALFIALLCLFSGTSIAASPRIAPPLDDILKSLPPAGSETGAGAVVLQHTIRQVIDASGTSDETDYVAVRILDDKAVDDYRQITEYFNSFYTSIHLDFARVIDSQGRIHEPDAGSIQIQSPNKEYMLDDQRVLTFALPGLETGATLEFQVTRHEKPRIAGQWFTYSFLYYIQQTSADSEPRLDPVRRVSITVDEPAEVKLAYDSPQYFGTPHTTTRNGRTTLTWDADDLPGITIVEGMQNLYGVMPFVEMSSLSSWSAIDAWSSGHLKAATPESALVKRTVKDLIHDGMSRDDRIKTLFYFVENNIRYINAHVSMSGYVPRPSDEVLRNRFGDCKDQSTLLVALLRAAGITAYPALVSGTNGVTPNPRIPNLTFSHMIVHVPGQDGGIWLDTTGSNWQYPGIDSTLEGATAFVIDGAGGRLMTIPATAAADNTATLHISYRYDGTSIHGQSSFSTTGVLSNRLKSAARSGTQFTDYLKNTIKGTYPSATDIGLEIKGDKDSRVPFSFKITYTLPNSWNSTQEEIAFNNNIIPLLSMFTPYTTLPESSGRRFDYRAPMPVSLTMVVDCPAPSPDYRPKIASRGKSIAHEFVDMTLDSDIDATGVHMKTRMTLPKRVIARGDFRTFAAKISEAIKESAWTASFRKDAGYAQQTRLEENLRTNNSVDAILELAQHELKVANYARARDLATDAVGKAPNNGQAHYILGIALGFLDEYEKSAAALSKARALGFKP